MEKYLSRIAFPLAAIALLASCASDKEQPETPVDGTKAPLTFTSQLRGLTRATETDFEAGDAISLFAVKSQGDEAQVVLASEGNHFQNLQFVYNGTQFASDPQVYKADSEKLAYFAVYPYSASCGANFRFEVKADQSDRTLYTQSDLCTASTGYTSEAQPNLTFFHRLSNLQVTLEGNNLAGDLSVEVLNAATTADIDLNNLTVTTTDSRSTIIPMEYGTNTWRAIVAPMAYPAGTPIVRVTLNGKVHELAHTSNIEMGSGRQVNITLRVVNDVPVIVSGDIYPWDTAAEISYVVPVEILDKLDDHIDIHYGVNPPNIEGAYFIDPFETVYCEDYGNGGYAPGDLVTSHYTLFHNQDMVNRTINYSEMSTNQTTYSLGNGAFISGEGQDFTVFFSTEGESRNIYTKQALVISGTKTDTGIRNLQYAFVMVDKGDDPEQLLMDKGIYRVFRDGDYLAVNTEWPFEIPTLRVPSLLKKYNSELILRKK